jgi:hypothetical protein
MGIEIPKKIFGREVEGAMERALAKKNDNEPESPLTDMPSHEGFEYVSSIGLYVAKEKELFNNDWNQSQTVLHERGDRMPTITEYVAFINYLRTQNTDEAKTILDEIYTVRSPVRREWLDAKFDVNQGNISMDYHIFGSSGIERKTAILSNALMEDKSPGINLDSWLADNEYGVPKSTIGNGDLWYWHPRNNSVARFDAYSGRTVLNCNRLPSVRNASLGVRAVRRANIAGGVIENLGGGE